TSRSAATSLVRSSGVSLTSSEIGHLLLAVLLLLAAAHAFGHLFARARQPRVVGEIIGGLMLGPTVLGAIAPSFEHALFEEGRVTPPVLGAIVQFGLQILMFVSGSELRAKYERRERRTATFVSVAGTTLPVASGLAL